MARMHQFIGLAVLSFALTGCVTSTDKYTAVKLENESLRSQLSDSESRARAAQAQAEAYKNQVSQLANGVGDRDGLVQNLQSQNATLAAQIADLTARYEEALKGQGSFVALPAAVTSALDGFAKQNSDLVDFDAARGIVKFKTDFTFATGSDTLTEKAKAAIGRFAQILNSDAARGYELMVAGHTDNTPVVNPATKTRHPDNWYLSSHRAITVGEELQRHGISPQRIADVGYADQRPIASNGTTEGKAQNRRVEVLILPSTVRSSVASKAAGSPTHSSNSKSKPGANLNKDTVATPDRGPVLNK
jgi:chemotaxis protein MotB